MQAKHYDCSRCQGYCCTYPIIQLRRKDCLMLAKGLGITLAEFTERYTAMEDDDGKQVRVLLQTADRKLGAKACVFLDRKTRKCTVYDWRPKICREHPGDDVRCEWFDRMILESIGRGRVIKLKQMPTNIDGDRAEYDSDRLPELFDSYVFGDKTWPAED